MSKTLLNATRQLYRQVAVYWGASGRNEYGDTTFQTPVEILVLLLQKSEAVVDFKNETYISRSQVLTNSDLQIGGYLFLGGLSELNTEQKADPRSIVGILAVKSVEKTLIPGTGEYARKCYL